MPLALHMKPHLGRDPPILLSSILPLFRAAPLREGASSIAEPSDYKQVISLLGPLGKWAHGGS